MGRGLSTDLARPRTSLQGMSKVSLVEVKVCPLHLRLPGLAGRKEMEWKWAAHERLKTAGSAVAAWRSTWLSCAEESTSSAGPTGVSAGLSWTWLPGWQTGQCLMLGIP